ncbi:MAG: SDR family oxidoreductase, partial [Flavobacteriaceae bacterium]|nr:SDR family oxidoreductase [Flavobacteriaceae bacterium]
MKTLLIVGGSKGIGKAILSRHLPDHKIINLSRSSPDLKHENLTHIPFDVLHDELPVVETIDKLVYCPGSIHLKPVNRFTLEDFKSDFDINVLGAIRTIQWYLPALKKGKLPGILLFSTVATQVGMPFHTSIAASKAAVEGFARSLAAEVAPLIRVNVIAPTITDTELAGGILRNDTIREKMNEKHPLKSFLAPENVA